MLTGEVKDADQLQAVEQLSEDMSGWLEGTKDSNESSVMAQVYTITYVTNGMKHLPQLTSAHSSYRLSDKESSEYTDVPKKLRSHWDTVFMDDIAVTESEGSGKTYESFGIGGEGCIVVVRPDGHVAAVAPLQGVEVLKQFFSRISNNS